MPSDTLTSATLRPAAGAPREASRRGQPASAATMLLACSRGLREVCPAIWRLRLLRTAKIWCAAAPEPG